MDVAARHKAYCRGAQPFRLQPSPTGGGAVARGMAVACRLWLDITGLVGAGLALAGFVVWAIASHAGRARGGVSSRFQGMREAPLRGKAPDSSVQRRIAPDRYRPTCPHENLAPRDAGGSAPVLAGRSRSVGNKSGGYRPANPSLTDDQRFSRKVGGLPHSLKSAAHTPRARPAWLRCPDDEPASANPAPTRPVDVSHSLQQGHSVDTAHRVGDV